ncbi:hypothetical protein [Streptomyces sp. NBC_01465]|uniref:hypothetical protein n=1 Tax=Streptomyces sp. NBC_01465 TaxID=2903878 RepID=UPI002E321BE2|nr:hypothetical protein [Streptomyces sp. NBC_01465]
MRQARRWAAVLAAVLLVGGCGIRSTDVVEVGDPATAQIGTPGHEGVTLYFQGPDRLMPVVRSNTANASPVKVFAMLFAGPTQSEKAAGLRTELPAVRAWVDLERGQGDVVLRMHGPVAGLSAVARQQLVCTAAYLGGRSGVTTVRIDGSDEDTGSASCLV